MLEAANIYIYSSEKKVAIPKAAADHNAALVGLPRVDSSISVRLHGYSKGSEQQACHICARRVQMSLEFYFLYTIFWLPSLTENRVFAARTLCDLHVVSVGEGGGAGRGGEGAIVRLRLRHVYQLRSYEFFKVLY